MEEKRTGKGRRQSLSFEVKKLGLRELTGTSQGHRAGETQSLEKTRAAVCPQVDRDRGTKREESAKWPQVVPEFGRLLGREKVKNWYKTMSHPGLCGLLPVLCYYLQPQGGAPSSLKPEA